MTNSKEDSELEEILRQLVDYMIYDSLGQDRLPPKEMDYAKAIQAIKAHYISRKEVDRRVLEARIDELSPFVSNGADARHYAQQRIAELKELLKGDKQ